MNTGWINRLFVYTFLLLLPALLFQSGTASAEMERAEFARLVKSQYKLGEKDKELPIWALLNPTDDSHIGYIFESEDLASIPGFSGTPIKLLISINLKGEFLDVAVLDQREPVFVAGLGVRPLHQFVQQYQGLSLASNIKVSTPYDGPERSLSANVYVDGVTKATASVRIVNEIVLASALKVARERLSGVAPRPAGRPKPDLFSKMSWQQLIDAGLIKHLRILNKDMEKAFAGSYFEDDDPLAREEPDGLYLDLWVADLGLPTVARNLLSAENRKDMTVQVNSFEEPVLVLANGRHTLVNEDFVPNSVPDRLSVRQGDYPVNIRDSDMDVRLLPGTPEFEQAMILRIDTRIGFDPASPWALNVKTLRAHGSFRPVLGQRDFSLELAFPEDFYDRPEETIKGPPWLTSWLDQRWNLLALSLFLGLVSYVLIRQKWTVAAINRLTWGRVAILAVTLGFVGWYGQGQLSMVTIIGLVKVAVDGGSFSFLLYDPFSLLLWVFVIVSLFLWGRGTFCGWLCPYGVLQEFSYRVARWLKIPEVTVPEGLDGKLIRVKYTILAGLLIAAGFAPNLSDRLVEVEPFKTAITLSFVRAWPYVCYAAAWLVLSMVVFKGFCRYICPLGAWLALLGRVRFLGWIPRRSECGTPCQLCKVRCSYKAIDRTGNIDYQECFQCLDCVEIYEQPSLCVPLILADKKPLEGADYAN